MLRRLVLLTSALTFACGSDPEASAGSGGAGGSAGGAGAAGAAGADAGPPPEEVDLFAAVDPRIGTGGVGFGVGSSYPGPAVPFAMIHPSPDTFTAAGTAVDFYHCSGYYSEDPTIGVFSLVHFHGTGVPDYGTMGFFPSTGMTAEQRTSADRRARFAKADEEASPGFYAVRLESGIRVSLTASERAAHLRFEFPSGLATPTLIVDPATHLGGEVRAATASVDAADGTLRATTTHFGPMSGGPGGYTVHARGALDVIPVATGAFDAGGLQPGASSVDSATGGLWLEFPSGTTAVTLRVAISFVDDAGAAGNLAAEAPTFDFDGMRAAAEATWREALGALRLWGASEYDTTVTATALYHALLMPTLTSDVDGRTRDVSHAIVSPGYRRYTDLSLWDTYRTLHPWLLLTEHERNADFVATMVGLAEEGGAVPVWAVGHGDSHTMIGSPGEIVLAESALKGVPFADEERAFELAKVAAYGPSPGPVGGRDETAEYISLGYVPADVGSGAAAKTLEYAVADGALGRWAARLGHDADAAELSARGQSYRETWDPAEQFFRGRRTDGTFPTGFVDTRSSDDFVEGNAWHYLWMVPHDPDGLAELLGGREAALERLRGFFELSREEVSIAGTRKYYWPSNEPDITAPWYFAAWGAPGEGHGWLDWIVTELYTDGPDGIPGNDDGGTMSAWLLFAQVGLYPLPGTAEYIVAMPRHPRAVLARPSGDLTIEAEPAPAVGLRPARVLLDGTPLEGTRVSHEQLAGTHTLRFELEPIPQP